MDKKVKNLDNKLKLVKKSQKKYAKFSQKEVDKVFKEVALCANNSRIKLAKMAVEETKMGILEDKVIKNHFASEYIYNQYKDKKTCGIIEKDNTFGMLKVAEPIGVIGAIIPTTNPTSTAIFKILLALKTRNGIIISPHPRAKKCTIEVAKILLEAAVKAGAPENIISWVDKPSIKLTNDLMKSSDLILATGGPGMVKAAYSSGKPAIGVGAGNTPALIDDSADIKTAVNSILMSKSFDNGVICASEQSVLIMDSVYKKAKDEFSLRGGYILDDDETNKLRNVILKDGKLNSEIVGQSASEIAKLAGFKVDEKTKALIGEVSSVELNEPFSHEKLSPVLAMYKVKTFDEGLKKAKRLVELGGFGHTSVLYTNKTNSKNRIMKFKNEIKTGRILINMPASQGAIGDIYNFKLVPSLTLGCGSWGGNSISENVGVKHLLNIKTVAERRENMLWYRIPEKVYFKKGSLGVALRELESLKKKKVFIVTDHPLYNLGFSNKITKHLDEMGIQHKVFFDVEPDPSIETAKKGAKEMELFNPDTIIALGGGSPMDAAKIMWLLYEHPEVKFEDLAMRFMDIRKRVFNFPKLGNKAMMISIPTSAGTGSEVTPFAVITDNKNKAKYPLADYELTPDIAIIDSDLMMSMPKALIASSGIDALTHALEAYVSVLASEFSNGHALEAIKLIFEYLPRAYKYGEKDPIAIEKMAHASTLAGMAFANAFLGVCHSMAHKLGAAHGIPHGIANALLISHVIEYNAVDNPRKQTAFLQYKYPNAKSRYSKISDELDLGGKNEEEKVKLLIEEIESLKRKINIPKSIKESGISETTFMKSLDEMSINAFDDQCTGANPRYPLIKELKDIYIKAYK